MAKKAKQNSKVALEDKRAQVVGQTRKAAKAAWLAPVVLVSLVLMASTVGAWWFGSDKPEAPVAAVSGAAGQEVVSMPVADFTDGQARHFTHKTADGQEIRFFVLKSSDGVIRAAFDACDVCWPAGKGYRQDGDVMVCNNCGRRFASVQINEVKGGCNPAPLTREIQGDQVVIKVADILAGQGYFANGNQG